MDLDYVPGFQRGDAAKDITLRVVSVEKVSPTIAMNTPSSPCAFPSRKRELSPAY